MSWCCSSPYSARRYPYPDDGHLEEENVPIRTFGKYRSGSVLVPDDIDGLPSTCIPQGLASDPNEILYEAEIDQGRGCRALRPLLCVLTFLALPFAILYSCIKSVISSYGLNFDESCLWIRKEYMTRTYYRVYSNRTETNSPVCRLFGMCGCGSWNGDNILIHRFDRGAFGFRRVRAGLISMLCCIWPLYGWSIARQRCQCNGPPWYAFVILTCHISPCPPFGISRASNCFLFVGMVVGGVTNGSATFAFALIGTIPWLTVMRLHLHPRLHFKRTLKDAPLQRKMWTSVLNTFDKTFQSEGTPSGCGEK